MPQFHLEKFHLTFFKNYEDAHFTFGKSLNCIVGENGCGKTNLLDAIYWLGLTKSAFHTQDTYSIQHEADFMMLDGWFWKDTKPTQITCSLQRGQRKTVMSDKKAYERLSEHIGLFPMVLISPNDADLVREGSEERRRFVDGVLSQLDQHYLQNLLQYNKILTQRNTVLKIFAERNYLDHDLLDTYDEVLLPLANLIFDRRTQFLAQFEPLVKHYYAFLGDDREQIQIQYVSEIEKLNFREIFRQYRTGDINAHRTLMGIHKDEFVFEMDGQLIRKFGSQGQQKSFVMALRLAQFDLLSVEKEMKPLLLLDDIFDKLDDRRIQKLLQLVENETFGQVFLTDARPERTQSLTQHLQTEVKFFDLVK
ncbi:MAG: DNA replication and repair protein RecF [Spirosomaceae bacterium]|jgi:DNA replication and repair protein RecF|nr:DNA replication and repair protein RecF [Spirosomataceae bacterium]